MGIPIVKRNANYVYFLEGKDFAQGIERESAHRCDPFAQAAAATKSCSLECGPKNCFALYGMLLLFPQPLVSIKLGKTNENKELNNQTTKVFAVTIGKGGGIYSVKNFKNSL